jgi:hypothetical protein
MAKCVICTEQVPSGRVCCVSDWRGLPPRVQAAVQERLRGWKNEGAAREFVQMWHRNQKG